MLIFGTRFMFLGKISCSLDKIVFFPAVKGLRVTLEEVFSEAIGKKIF